MQHKKTRIGIPISEEDMCKPLDILEKAGFTFDFESVSAGDTVTCNEYPYVEAFFATADTLITFVDKGIIHCAVVDDILLAEKTSITDIVDTLGKAEKELVLAVPIGSDLAVSNLVEKKVLTDYPWASKMFFTDRLGAELQTINIHDDVTGCLKAGTADAAITSTYSGKNFVERVKVFKEEGLDIIEDIREINTVFISTHAQILRFLPDADFHVLNIRYLAEKFRALK